MQHEQKRINNSTGFVVPTWKRGHTTFKANHCSRAEKCRHVARVHSSTAHGEEGGGRGRWQAAQGEKHRKLVERGCAIGVFTEKESCSEKEALSARHMGGRPASRVIIL